MGKSVFSPTTLPTTMGWQTHIADEPLGIQSRLVVQEMETDRGWTTSEMPVLSTVSFQRNGNLKFGSRLPCQHHFPDCA